MLADLYARSSEAFESLTAAAEEVLPSAGSSAQIVNRRGAYDLLAFLVLGALATLAALWAEAVSSKSAIICLTSIAAILWTLLLTVRPRLRVFTYFSIDNSIGA